MVRRPRFPLALVAADRQTVAGPQELTKAVVKGDKELVTRLLAGGANVDERDSTGWTPLRKAIDAFLPHAVHPPCAGPAWRRLPPMAVLFSCARAVLRPARPGSLKHIPARSSPPGHRHVVPVNQSDTRCGE
jgi:hypothetical protein